MHVFRFLRAQLINLHFYKSNLAILIIHLTTARYFCKMAMHSQPKLCKSENYSVQVLPALEDNFMYIITEKNTKDAFVVDPVDPDLVLKTVKELGSNLLGILTTHHHWDHAGGNNKMKQAMPQLEIYGGDDRVEGITKKLGNGSKLTLGSLEIQSLFTPCHTSGHLCYYIIDQNSPAVFTGDTLFIGGCGRFFEGTATQMYKALVEILAALPEKTDVFCGHEYTVSDLKYGQHVEPDNKDIAGQLEIDSAKRGKKEATVPSTIGLEKLINPFMRVKEASVLKHCKTQDSIAAMDYLRNEKNNFKG